MQSFVTASLSVMIPSAFAVNKKVICIDNLEKACKCVAGSSFYGSISTNTTIIIDSITE